MSYGLDFDIDDLSELPYDERVRIGKMREALVRKRIAATGKTIELATDGQDKEDKIDSFVNGEPLQIKTRDKRKGRPAYNDILLDFYEPFYGWESPYNKPAKDQATKAEWFAILFYSGRIVMVSAAHMKTLFAVVAWEWRQTEVEMQKHGFTETLSNRFDSKKHPGVWLQRTVDNKNNRHKLLMFVTPDKIRHIEIP